MGPATATSRSLKNTLGESVAPTVYPHGPEWGGKVAPYTPSYNTPHSPGACPPPLFHGTLPRSTLFRTQPEPAKLDPFGNSISLTFEMRRHSHRNMKSGHTISINTRNDLPLGRLLDTTMSKAFETGVLQGRSHRILSVVGPSGKLLKVGSGLTLYDQSPPVPPGSTLILVFQD